MSKLNIHKALTQSVIDLALGVTLAHENVDFDLESFTGDAFIDLTNLPVGRESLTKSDLHEDLGVYQISYYQRSGTSVGSALADIDTITDFYKQNRTISNSGTTIVIISTSLTSLGNTLGWFRNDISVNYKADIQL
jgi:hypothetical protein